MVGIAQLVRASDCGSEGRGFESHYLPNKSKNPAYSGVFYYNANTKACFWFRNGIIKK